MIESFFNTEIESHYPLDFATRPKRLKTDGNRHYDSNGKGHKLLELQGVVDVLKTYEDYEGGINCCICGKLYKSKVCFTKHIWEHTVYWDLFEGAKNHERVLAIQAAIILYNGYQRVDASSNATLSHLLVTSPNDKKKEKDLNGNDVRLKCNKNGNDVRLKCNKNAEKKLTSPMKRKIALYDDMDVVPDRD